MHLYRFSAAAALLGVSDDTLRRWAEAGRFPTTEDSDGRRAVAGPALAALAVELADEPDSTGQSSARNRFSGIITRVLRGEVMSQVEIQSGRHRLVALISTEAVDELGLTPGTPAVATVKSTNVIVEKSTHVGVEKSTHVGVEKSSITTVEVQNP